MSDFTGTLCPSITQYIAEYKSAIRFTEEDIDVLNDYCEQLNERDISIRKEKETLLSGSFTATDDECILFTIPWDEDWYNH